MSDVVRLDECPTGLFLFDDTLCFRSVYTTTLDNPRRYQPDAYVVETGEYFWGGAQSVEERSALMVRPITYLTPDEVTAREAAAADLVEVTRYPVIEAVGDLRPKEWVDLIVDLSKDAHSGSEPVSLGKFPADWARIEIAVQVIAPWASETVAETALAVIMADGASEPARFRCLVSPGYLKGSPAQVHAVFLHGTRICGHIVRDLAAMPAELELEPAVTASGGPPRRRRAGPTSTR